MVTPIAWELRQARYALRRTEHVLAYWLSLTPERIAEAHSRGRPVPEAIAELRQQVVEQRELLARLEKII